MDKAILVTGGMGFIGSNFIRYYLKAHPSCHLINLDKLTYSANPENLQDLSAEGRYQFVRGDILDETLLFKLCQDHSFQSVIHFAAESHVDRSILGSREFIQTNILGTHTLLEVFKRTWRDLMANDPGFRFLYVSTDEVYGSLGMEGLFTETTPFSPNSPYSASKAGADLLVHSYFETYGFPTLVVRPSNNYGPFQFPEKFIPLMISNLLEDHPIPVYGRGSNIRDWLYVEDTCRAIDRVLQKGRPGQAYNIGGESERTNLEVARQVLSSLKKDEKTYLRFVADRPGHDLRYALSNEKIKSETGWHPSVPFSEGIARTIAWFQDKQDWWRPVKERLQQESKGFWSRP
jgi:dTDP-glucose 4,6-dehydratase